MNHERCNQEGSNVLLEKLRIAATNTSLPCHIRFTCHHKMERIQNQAESIDYAKTIQTEGIRLTAELAKVTAQRDAAYSDIQFIEDIFKCPTRTLPCKICKFVDGCVSDDKSTCQGFMWSGPRRHNDE